MSITIVEPDEEPSDYPQPILSKKKELDNITNQHSQKQLSFLKRQKEMTKNNTHNATTFMADLNGGAASTFNPTITIKTKNAP